MKRVQLHQRPWFTALLALSLMLSQALWLLHRVAHNGAHSGAYRGAHAEDVSATHGSGHTVSGHAGSHAANSSSTWLKALLPEHADELSCAHFDQLGHADALPGCVAPQGLSQPHAHALPATHVASSLAAQAAGFLARGPPATA